MYTATRSFTDHEMVAVQAFAAPAGSIEGVLAALEFDGIVFIERTTASRPRP